MNNILLFGGRASGKDTVVDMILQKVPNAEQLRIAQFVVGACHALGIKNPTRDDLKFVGHDIGRMMIDPDIWIKMSVDYAKENTDKILVVSDCRYPNEYEAFVNLGFTPVLVDCKEETRIERAILRDGYFNYDMLHHESENHFKKFSYDLKLDNNGDIISLGMQVDKLIRGD